MHLHIADRRVITKMYCDFVVTSIVRLKSEMSIFAVHRIAIHHPSTHEWVLLILGSLLRLQTLGGLGEYEAGDGISQKLGLQISITTSLAMKRRQLMMMMMMHINSRSHVERSA